MGFRVSEGLNPDDSPRFKARLIAKGFTQKEGIKYIENFTLVVKHKTLGLLLSRNVFYDWKLEQLDVKTTFVYCDLLDTYI